MDVSRMMFLLCATKIPKQLPLGNIDLGVFVELLCCNHWLRNWFSCFFCCFYPQFHHIEYVVKSFFVGVPMCFASWEFWYICNVCLIPIAPLDVDGVVLCFYHALCPF